METECNSGSKKPLCRNDAIEIGVLPHPTRSPNRNDSEDEQEITEKTEVRSHKDRIQHRGTQSLIGEFIEIPTIKFRPQFSVVSVASCSISTASFLLSVGNSGASPVYSGKGTREDPLKKRRKS